MTSDRRLLVAVLGAFVLMVALAAADVMADLREGTTLGHVGLEGIILVIGMGGAALVTQVLLVAIRSAKASSREARILADQLAQSAADATRWRDEAKDLMRGLGRAIDEQFERWELSPAEKEVGLLLLKGLSHKEIADVRSVTEATARQQAGALYKKARLSGRHDLSAFFLEDLMLPSEQTTPDGT